MRCIHEHVAGRSLIAGTVVGLTLLPAGASAERLSQPLQFFAGRTEMISIVKVMMKKPYRSRTLGSGKILSDGSLALTQQVFDEGKAPEQRHWKIRQVAPGRYVGTMSEAAGPVSVQEVGGKYRFKFKMRGNLAVEQWMTPVGGDAARSRLTVRKLGMTVASSTGTIRRI